MTTAVAGRSAAEPWPASDRPAIIDAIARFADRLHGLPADGCPFDNRLHPVEFTEEPVVCHGDFMLPNVIIDPAALEVPASSTSAASASPTPTATTPTWPGASAAD